MPAINFDSRFANAVESGRKTQTIRNVRKDPIRVGDTLLLTAGSQLIMDGTYREIGEAVCTGLDEVLIEEDEVSIYQPDGTFGMGPSREWLDEFAKCDGFKDWPEMRDFFQDHYGFPFGGVIIHWELKTKEGE